MNDYLKGNYRVKKEIKEKNSQSTDKKKKFKDEYTKRAIESVSGSMVFIEKDLLVWDGESEVEAEPEDK